MREALALVRAQLKASDASRQLPLLMEALPKLLAMAEKLAKLPKPPAAASARLSDAEWGILSRYVARRDASGS